jgi:hypothetical protein
MITNDYSISTDICRDVLLYWGKQFLLDMCLGLSLDHPVTVGYITQRPGTPGWVLDARPMTWRCKKITAVKSKKNWMC